MSVIVDGEHLTLEQVVRVARGGERVELAPGTAERMARSREVVERALERDDAVYGMTTGLGASKRHRVAAPDSAAFNRALLESHRIGHGPPAPADAVRASMLRLLNGFAKGTTGVRPLLAQRLADALNDGSHPRVRMLGSAGMADLAPLGDLAHELFADVELAPKEGLALVNNSSFSTALSALALADAQALADSMTVTAALDLEAFAANVSTLDPAVATLRPYPGVRTELEGLRSALEGSYLWAPAAARNLQDPLSYRGVVQIGGAARDALSYALAALSIEAERASRQPGRSSPTEGRIFSAELLRGAAARRRGRFRADRGFAPALTGIDRARAVKLLQPPLSARRLAGSPSGEGLNLREDGGGLVVRPRAHRGGAPARRARLPSSWRARPRRRALATASPRWLRSGRGVLAEQVDLGRRILAVGLMISAQALDLRAPGRLGAVDGRDARISCASGSASPGAETPIRWISSRSWRSSPRGRSQRPSPRAPIAAERRCHGPPGAQPRAVSGRSHR